LALQPILVHNYYQRPGGEDQVFADEAALLESNGHRVIRYEEHNSRIAGRNAALVAVGAAWSLKSARSFSELIRHHNSEVVHFHNTFPLISPSAYYAAQREGAAVVQTLHNFRLLCPGATLFREGNVCEECIEKKSLLPAITHACYRGSRRDHAHCASNFRDMAAEGRPLHCVKRIRPPKVHRRRIAGKPDCGEAKFRFARSPPFIPGT
jgi:hypothetical protein